MERIGGRVPVAAPVPVDWVVPVDAALVVNTGFQLEAMACAQS